MGVARSADSWADRVVVVLMAQDSYRVGCRPWPIGHHLLMTYLRGAPDGEVPLDIRRNPRSGLVRAVKGAEALRHDMVEATYW